MIISYALRLLCLCSACFFLVYALLSLAVRSVSAQASRLAGRMKPRLAARFLFALRLFPIVSAVIAVAGLCVPSYLWLEPRATAERMGLVCFTAALSGVGLWLLSFVRVGSALARTVRFNRHCRRAGQATPMAEESFPVITLEDDAPALVLAGVIHPRIVISRSVLRAFSSEQLDVALEHERAHRASRDNLKRLLLLLAPDVFPFSNSFAVLDHAWSRFSEWAADDRAVKGDSLRALSLASALVSIARMGAAPRRSLLVTSLLASDDELSERVDRLLRPVPSGEKPPARMHVFIGGAACLVAAALAVLILWPTNLYAVHRLLEHLVR